MNLARLVVWGAICASGLFQESAVAQDAGTRALAPVFQVLTSAIDKALFRQLEVSAVLQQLQEQLQVLEQGLNRRPAPLPEEYVQTFVGYRNDLLVVQDHLQSRAATELFKSLLADLEIKNRFVVETAGFWPLQKSPLIKVKVVTMRGTEPAPGYRVACNPRRDADRGAALFPFPSDTNNAVLAMPPGLYRLQLFRGDQQVHARDALIGSVGSDEEVITIDVTPFASL